MDQEIIKVLIVDDSTVIRRLFSSILGADDRFDVVGAAKDGDDALTLLRKLVNEGKEPHVITLDIEMPNRDGLATLPEIFRIAPKSKVVMVSSLTQKGAEKTIRALSLGASECIGKPMIEELDRSQLVRFGEEVKHKIEGLADVAKPSIQTAVFSQDGAYTLREKSVVAMPQVLAIGSSTGGPKALHDVLVDLSKRIISVPIFITQHMPVTFVKLLAQQLTRETGLQCVEVEDGQIAEPGKVYIAPGGYHMKVEKNDAGQFVCHHLDTEPENFCKPAVDPMLRSLADCTDGRMLITILTGMGADGQKGCEYAIEKGAIVIAQDKASSVIWGMPGAVAQAGLCTAVEPLSDVPAKIAEFSQGKIV